MGHLWALAHCYGCGKLFGFNPELVPSITPPGKAWEEREPICRPCVDRVNPRRIAGGLPAIVPPPGAYDPVDEEELP